MLSLPGDVNWWRILEFAPQFLTPISFEYVQVIRRHAATLWSSLVCSLSTTHTALPPCDNHNRVGMVIKTALVSKTDTSVPVTLSPIPRMNSCAASPPLRQLRRLTNDGRFGRKKIWQCLGKYVPETRLSWMRETRLRRRPVDESLLATVQPSYADIGLYTASQHPLPVRSGQHPPGHQQGHEPCGHAAHRHGITITSGLQAQHRSEDLFQQHAA
jgi:hypothetical protein